MSAASWHKRECVSAPFCACAEERIAALESERDALRAEIARLTVALREVRSLAEDWIAYADEPWALMGKAIVVMLDRPGARAALSSSPRAGFGDASTVEGGDKLNANSDGKDDAR